MEKFNERDFKKIETDSNNTSDIKLGFYYGNLIRIIPKEKINDYKRLLKFSNSIKNLIPAEIFFEDENRLILKHPIIKNITFPPEWTNLQKIEAARTILNIQKELMKKGYCLIDPHGYNVVFDKDKPVFIDFGAFAKGKIFPIYWFWRLFLNYERKDYWGKILKLSKVESLLVTIKMVFEKDNPYSAIENKLNKLWSKEIKERDSVKRDYLEKILKFPKIKSFLKIIRKQLINNYIYCRIEDLIPKSQGGKTKWSYYNQQDNLDASSKRVLNFITLLKKDSPKKLLDIGANKGGFSKLALKYGVEEIIAIDIDDKSLDFLREDVKNDALPIWIAKIDLMNHPKKLGDSQDMPSAESRLNADYCICFAVIHHLCYFGNYTFEDFAVAIDRFVNKILIVEFVPPDDICLSGSVYRGEDKSWYNEENFINVMKKYFKGNIEIFDSDPAPRKLIKFQKK